MQIYYSNLEAIEQQTRQLDQVQCRHCVQRHQLVSHGFFYKKRVGAAPQALGKRVFCSNRQRYTGCGRTMQLYLDTIRVLNAVHDAPGNTMRERIKCIADKPFTDVLSGHTYRFTWRTISTWLYRHKKHGIATLQNKTRCDKDSYRKVQVNQLAEAIHEVLPTLAHNKVGVIPRSVLYRVLLARGFFVRAQLVPRLMEFEWFKQRPLLRPGGSAQWVDIPARV